MWLSAERGLSTNETRTAMSMKPAVFSELIIGTKLFRTFRLLAETNVVTQYGSFHSKLTETSFFYARKNTD